MPAAPIAKAVIITASIVVAAGIAFYENPQVRQWVDQSRRKIAVALHSLGDEINPNQSSSRRGSNNAQNDEETRRRNREDILRRNRAEMIRRAREEGVAVDLDELAAIGRKMEEEEETPPPQPPRRKSSGKSFDELVDSEGKLLPSNNQASTAKTTATDTSSASTLRNRGSQGLASGSAFADPFADEFMFERPDTPMQSRGAPAEGMLVDIDGPTTPRAVEPVELDPEFLAALPPDVREEVQAQHAAEQARIAQKSKGTDMDTTSFLASLDPALRLAILREQDEDMLAQLPPQFVAEARGLKLEDSVPGSFPSMDIEKSTHEEHSQELLIDTSPAPVNQSSPSASTLHFTPAFIEDDESPTGPPTPTDDGFASAVSVAASNDDVGVISASGTEAGDFEIDVQSVTESEAFSDIGEGAPTPSSWTDVGSDEGDSGDEWAGQRQHQHWQ